MTSIGRIIEEEDARLAAAQAATAEVGAAIETHSWDDHGNAARLHAFAGEQLRWVEDLEVWAAYADGRWVLSKDAGHAQAMSMIETVLPAEAALYSSAKVDGEKSERTRFKEWAAKQRYVTAHRNAASALRHSGRVAILSSDFDLDPMLLNCPNGIIDLRTGALGAHVPARLMRQMVGAEYVPGAPAPRWSAFLETVMPDPQMRSYLQRVVGYSLTGQTGEQVMFMHYGDTANGKSVMLRVVEAVLGSYGQVVPSQTLLSTSDEKHPTDVNRMEGKRMLQTSETPQGRMLDEALIKRLTGQETITARGMGKDFRDFRIVGKIHMVTNHLPHINADPATHRRVRTIHWGVTIPEEQRDPMLAQSIIESELPGVLAWAVQGALAWQREGLKTPLVAQMDADAYFHREDSFGQWLDERTLMTEDSGTATKTLYADYDGWCRQYNIKPMQVRAWADELSKRGYARKKMARGERGWRIVLTTSGEHLSA